MWTPADIQALFVKHQMKPCQAKFLAGDSCCIGTILAAERLCTSPSVVGERLSFASWYGVQQLAAILEMNEDDLKELVLGWDTPKCTVFVHENPWFELGHKSWLLCSQLLKGAINE